MGEKLQELSERLAFRCIDGIAERLIFREFYPRGMTAFDEVEETTLGTRPTLSHATARQEMQNLLDAMARPAWVAAATRLEGVATRSLADSRCEHHDPSADRRSLVEMHDVFVCQANASGGNVCPDGPGFVGAVNSVEGVLLSLPQVERARAERVIGTAWHSDTAL